MSLPLNFPDIQNHWAKECILQLAQREIISGYPDGTFRPEAKITRAEIAALLLKAYKAGYLQPSDEALNQSEFRRTTFTDVSENFWAKEAIEFAASRRFFVGYSDGSFHPNQWLPRGQALVILASGLMVPESKTPTETLNQYYDDVAEIPEYAKGAIAAATENRLVVNYPNVRQLQPNRNATRGEIAALLCQAFQIANAVPTQYIPQKQLLVIQPRFDEAEAFSEGIAWVKIGDTWGAIDKTGKVVISPEYYTHYPFSNGLTLVTIGGKYRYLDKLGKIVIQRDVEKAFSFSEGLAAVMIGGKFGYIDTTGNLIIQPRFELGKPFSEGLAAVKLEGKTGFIDKTGQFIIEPQFNWADPFSDGVTWGAIDNRFGIIDKTGNLVEVNLNFSDTTGAFSEGLARVSVSGSDGFVDKTGQLVIPAQFNVALPFSEGLSAVFVNGKAGFIDKTGKIAIALQFDSADSFADRLARVLINGKFGYIDKTGNFAIEPQFEKARDFSEGFAAVYIGDRWGYITNPLR